MLKYAMEKLTIKYYSQVGDNYLQSFQQTHASFQQCSHIDQRSEQQLHSAYNIVAFYYNDTIIQYIVYH